MAAIDPKLVEELRQQGRFDDVLTLLQRSYAAVELLSEPTWPDLFMTMLEWKQLAQEYAPARAALAHVRDEQVRRLTAGDLYVGRRDLARAGEHLFGRIKRFWLITELNEALGDARSTWELFTELDAGRPDLAREYAWRALPAIVACGDFALADRYRGEPLRMLDCVNDVARAMPLFPPPDGAPRLAAELMSLVGDVRIGAAVLRGQGSEDRAAELCGALLAGIESDEVKAWARRELDAPGAINKALVDRSMPPEGI
jgi:hypothetical protein